MESQTIHIGHEIEKRLSELKMTKTEFGRKLGIPQQNVNRILEKESIDAEKLLTISMILRCNFFTLYQKAFGEEPAAKAAPPKPSGRVSTRGDYSPASIRGDVSVVAASADALEALRHQADTLRETIGALHATIDTMRAQLADKDTIIDLLRKQLPG